MRKPQRANGAKFWVQLEHYLLDTVAWRTLSANAKVTYVEVKRRYNGRNNGMISISAREAGDAIGASHHTGARALVELQEHGFIEVTEDSDFRRKVRVSRNYRLTEAADDRPGRGRSPSKDFIKWGPTTGPKFRTQSHPCDATVSPMIRDPDQSGTNGNDSRTDATVNPISRVSQSHPRDTYRLSASQGVRNGTR